MNFDQWSMRFDRIMKLSIQEFNERGFGTDRGVKLTSMLLTHCYESYNPKWNYGK